MKRNFKNSATEKLTVNVKEMPMYPMMYCLDEGIPICVATRPIQYGQRMSKDHYEGASFRKGYEINFDNYKEGQRIVCPKCKGGIDLRLWPSDTVPQIVE